MTTVTRRAVGSRRIPLHDHSDINSGGKLRGSAAIANWTGGGSAGAVEGDHNSLTGRDAAGSHPATAVSYSNATSGLTATQVQAALDELAAMVESSVPVDHGAMGAAETLDVTAGTWHRGTLDAGCTITVSGFTVDEGAVVLFEVLQDGTGAHAITWDADVDFGGADDQPDQAAGSLTVFALFTSTGDTAVHAAKVGGGGAVAGTPALTLSTTNSAGAAATFVATDATVAVFDATAPITQAFGDVAATGSASAAARRDHVHGMPAEPAGIGPILISDTPSTPLVFADLIQNEAQTDLVYADP